MKNLFYFVVIIVAVVGSVRYNMEDENELSKLELVNIEALADETEGILPKGCKGCVERQDDQCQCNASIYHGYGLKKIKEL